MKKLLFAMLCIVSALGLRAQEDVTTQYITNPSFEKDGNLSAGNKTTPNIITPTGWTQEQNAAGSFQDNKICDESTSNASNYGTTVTPSDGTYYLFYRHGWNGSNYAKFTSSAANLPAGIYKLTVDYKMVSGSDDNSNNDNTSITLSAISGETTLGTTTAKGAVQVNNKGTTAVLKDNDWITLETTFSLNAETSTQFVINLLACGPKRSDFVVDNVRLYFTPIIRPTAISLNENSLAMKLTQKSTLSVTYTPADANTDTNITWTTSDPAVATVDAGVVTAVGFGNATITATTANSVSATCTVNVTDVTPVAAPAFYSEVATGDFYIVNAATGKYLGGANSWGTQASQIEHGIPFTVAVSDGKYTVDSHTYNKEAEHFFTGTFVDGASTNLYITSLGSGKYSISTADGSAFVTANVNDNIVANTAANANSVLAQWYFVSKDNRDALFANATDAAPADATYYLTEANISRNLRKAYKTTAWTGTFSYGGANENQCAERYKATTNVYQTVSVPNGKYTVTCQGFFRRESGEATSYLYANDVQVALSQIQAGGINSMAAASEAFTNGEYNNSLTVYVTDGTLKVGIKCDAATNWTIWDNFTIAYHGPTVGGKATEIPMATETSMTAGKWYYFDIPVYGLYNLTTITLPNIVYTNDATVLIENENSVTATFSQDVNETLTAGRYFVKSASDQSLKVSFVAYAYSVGAAALSTADGGYTQSRTFTVTFPAAATGDPNATAALVASSKATVNGNEVALTDFANGFSLDLGSLTPSTDYVIAIPASVYGYADQSMNEAINVTLHTPAVFDGEYVLYDATNKLFLGRGAGYGTEATADKYGIPFTLVTDATGSSSFEFVDNTGVYLFITKTAIYTDNASTGWAIVPTTDGYYLRDAAKTVYATHDNGSFGEYVHTTTEEASATVWSFKTLAERDAIIAEYPTENIKNVITASGAATTADAFATYLSTNYNAEDLTSVVGTASFAGAAGDWTWTGYWRSEKGQPAYGTGFVEAWNATGAWSQTVDNANLPAGIYKITVQGYERRKNKDDAKALKTAGYNLVSTFLSANGEQVRFTDWNDVAGTPTNVNDATTAFGKGEATNELYIYLDGNTDLNLMVRKPNYIWDCWVIWNNITLTRYTPQTVSATIASSGYSTIASSYALDCANLPSGLKAYKVTGVTTTAVNLAEVSEAVAAGTGLILEGTAGQTYSIPVAVSGSDISSTNKLKAAVTATDVAANEAYILQGGKFHLVTGASTVPAGKAYLLATDVPANVRALDMVVGGDADGISAIDNAQSTGNAMFDLSGRRVAKAQKGIYIVNGKKVVK